MWLGATALRAGPTEDAIIDLMRLGEQSSYTWVMTISDDARTYDIDGKTDRAGYSRVTMPMINVVRRRLGRDVTDNRVEAIFVSNAACVLRTPLGWLRPDKLPEPDSLSDYERLGATSAVPIGKKRRTILTAPGGAGPKEPRSYSNLQLAISPPHEELAVIVSSHQEFKVDGEVVSGTLTEVGAALLLVRDGQPHITPLNASGDFKVWLRGRLPIRYQTNLKGTLAIASEKGEVKIAVQQRTFATIRDIGTTVVEVPEEAKIALAQ
ncbi:MAG TPA: hypothetical protein VGE76_20790 [Opitutaceae bacterium]